MSTHPFNPWSFAAGLVFVLVAIGWFVDREDLLSRGELAVAAPLLLIVLGAGGLALTLRRSR